MSFFNPKIAISIVPGSFFNHKKQISIEPVRFINPKKEITIEKTIFTLRGIFLEPKKGLDIRKADNLIDDKKNLNK